MSYLKHGQGKHASLQTLKPASSIPKIYQKYQHWNKTVYRIAVRGDPLKHFPCTYQESNQRSTIHRKEFTHVDILFRDRRLFQFELFYHFFQCQELMDTNCNIMLKSDDVKILYVHFMYLSFRVLIDIVMWLSLTRIFFLSIFLFLWFYVFDMFLM